MSGRRLYFGLFKISLLLELIPGNPDVVKTFFNLIYTNVTIPYLHPLEKWFLNCNPRHITLGHPLKKSYSDKTLCSLPPSVEFFASVMPTRTNQYGRAENILTVPTNVTRIVALSIIMRNFIVWV